MSTNRTTGESPQENEMSGKTTLREAMESAGVNYGLPPAVDGVVTVLEDTYIPIGTDTKGMRIVVAGPPGTRLLYDKDRWCEHHYPLPDVEVRPQSAPVSSLAEHRSKRKRRKKNTKAARRKNRR